LHDFHLPRQPETLEVLACARQRAASAGPPSARDRTASRSDRLEPRPEATDRLGPGVRPCSVVTWLSPQPPQPIQEALPAIFYRIAAHDPSP
jgi:hypothetical protein